MVFSVVDFADTIAAEQADDFAGGDLQGDAVQDVALAVISVHVLDQDERRRVLDASFMS